MAQSPHVFQILTKRPEAMRRFVKPLPLLPNVWLGTSVEDQKYHDLRVPFLRDTPAAIRFTSVEPILGPVKLDLRDIHWVIVGGESGDKYRMCENRMDR